MRIFGGILPFIGWREVFVDEDGEPSDGPNDYIADALEVEWFGFGAVVYIGNVRAYD